MNRASSLPVKACLNLPWKDFCQRLHQCWEQSTALADWAMVQLSSRDIVRLPGMVKLPPMPKIPRTRDGRKWLRGLYGLASVTFDFKGGFWKGAAPCASSIIWAVERRYRKERSMVIWSRKRSPARYRYPYPFPVHPSCWEVEFRSGRPVLSVKLPGGSVELELRTGPEFGRQIAELRRVTSGEAKKCQLLITRQWASEGCHRRTTTEKAPGGGSTVHYRIMVKVITEAPAREASGDRVLTLVTDPAALWVAELDGRQAWLLNADHIKRACDWQETHRARRQRWAEDCKAERRADPQKQLQFQESRDRCCEKHARRMKSWCQESAAHLARFAARQKVGTVAYDDADKSFMPSFPWHQLKTCLANALERHGIELVTAKEREEISEEVQVA